MGVQEVNLSCEHLFHFGLQVSVLPEGHLEMNMMITVMMMILIVNNHVDHDKSVDDGDDDCT